MDDIVFWHKRAWNLRADYLVNYTMDEQTSWFQRGPLPEAGLANSNLIVHMDGGTRAGKCSAAAWCIEAVAHYGSYITTVPVILAGTYIQDPISSFTAEALALEEAALAVHSIVSNLPSVT